MNQFFHYDSKVMSAIGKAADTIVLGLFWCLCAIPIFTVGASSSAFYYAYQKCIRQREDYICRTFFTAFKANFIQATQIWLIFLGLIFFLAADLYLLRFLGNTVLIIAVRTVLVVVVLFCILWGLYLFPHLSRFDVPGKTAMKNCALILLANLPQSLLLLLLFAVCALGFVCLPVLNLLIPALYMFLANLILEKVFRKYIQPDTVPI